MVRWTQQHDKYQPTHWPCLLFRDAHHQHGEHRITKLMSVRSTQYWCQRPLLGLKRCSESMATTQHTSTTESSCHGRAGQDAARGVPTASDSGHPRDGSTGRTRLSISPTSTGLATLAMTMGTVRVTALAARVVGTTVVTLKSALMERMISGKRSNLPSLRHSMTKFWPST